MKFTCSCGSVIRDQTDYLPYKAYLIADQDIYDALDISDQGSADWWPTLTRSIYQCNSCRRLWIDDHNNELKSFMPEQHANGFLTSIHGGKWKRVLRASWTDEPVAATLPRGFMSWTHQSDDDQATFDDWDRLENAYRSKFEELRSGGILRDAMLTKNGDRVHLWQPETKQGEQDAADQLPARGESEAP